MMRRNVFMMADVVYWPFIAVLSIGFMLAYLNPGARNVSVVLSGVIAMSVLQTCQLDVSYSLMFEMWSKSMKHTVVAPVSGRHYLLGAWLFGMIRATLTFLVISGFIRLIFKFNIAACGVGPTVLFVSGLFLSGLIVGMIIIVLLYTFGMRAEIATWSIVSLLLLVCGIYYPVSVLPGFLRAVGYAIPLTYFLEYYRGFYGVHVVRDALAKGYVLSAVYIVAFYLLHYVAVRRAKRLGTILKMSE
jgi:ABC-2 type transport system permease protein